MNIFVDYSNLDSVLNHFCQKLFYTETKLTEELIHCEDYVLDNLLKSTDQYLNTYSKVHKWIPIKRTSYQDTIMLVNKIKIAAINAYVIRKANSPYHAKSKLAMLATIENLFDASVSSSMLDSKAKHTRLFANYKR